ncbi:guanine nucleotide-binding protein subunit gamma 1-like isoform X1 [Telopea speciosissima]|uniref:guanine nucleotide-binding protein subunit gamma 1-like isoform X1 n=1 Tax=Telopea speciosissima TaxID=54955 RepID=UPI001CC69399|nr:guanine nucleotide-binding protein subunit gamma 1-like isoform X1 [Telopea speciosissima]
MQEVESETGSSVDLQVSAVPAADTRGKHRILAELKRLEQETRFLEQELEELEKTEKVSAACQEDSEFHLVSTRLLLNVGTKPDPLLPETVGPTNPTWDRWFEGPQESQGCNCWIL